MRYMKVQQVSEFETAEAQIAKQLAAVNGENRFDSLQLDDNHATNEKISSVPVVD